MASHTFFCIDAHTCGNPVRVVTAGAPLLPNLPSVAEQGYPGFDYTLWVGLWGPAKIPADLAAKINKDVNAALATPELRAQLTRLGTVPGNLTIPQFTEFVKKELEETKKILDAAGIKPQ